MIDEQVAILECRLTSKQLSPASTLLDRLIDNIDTTLVKTNDVNDQTASTPFPSDQFEKMGQLKHDIVQQSIITGRQMAEGFVKIVLDEKEKYYFKESDDESQSEMQLAGFNAIETRRLHMIQRAKCITVQKLATYFKQN